MEFVEACFFSGAPFCHYTFAKASVNAVRRCAVAPLRRYAF
jgi:hypothetical protein